MRRLFLVLSTLLAVLMSLNLAAAQGVATLTYGTTTTGTLSDASPAVLFVFNGNAGDFVAVQVTGIAQGMTVSVSLLGSAQQALGNDDSEPFGLNGRSARVTGRLPAAGVYSVLVSGTPGDFLVSLDSRTSSPLPVQPGTPTQVTAAVGAGLQYFNFSTDAAAQSSLQISSVNGSDFIAEVYDGGGRLVTTINGGLLNACLTLPPGASLYEMSIVSANRNVEGVFSVGLVSGGCASSSSAGAPATTPAQGIPTPVPQGNANPNQPIQIAGLCTASSPTNTNIRSGPGTNFDVVGMVVAGLGIEVTGQTTNGWYTVRGENLEGYVAASVVNVVGPCSSVPIVEAGSSQSSSTSGTPSGSASTAEATSPAS